jgi:hypothetical protein
VKKVDLKYLKATQAASFRLGQDPFPAAPDFIPVRVSLIVSSSEKTGQNSFRASLANIFEA